MAQFGSLAASAPIYSADPAVIQGLAAFLNGWSAATIPVGSPPQPVPPEQDFNALFFLVTYQLQYILDRGIAEYDSGTTYGQYSFCQVNGHIYRSNVNNNTGNNPPSSPTQWADYQALFDAAGAASAAQAAAIAAASADATTKANAAQAAAIAASDPAGTASAAVAAALALIAPQLLKARVTFSGDPANDSGGNAYIYSQFNVSLVTHDATGKWTVNFASPLANPYTWGGNCGYFGANLPGANNVLIGGNQYTNTLLSVWSWEPRIQTYEDTDIVEVMVF